MKTTLELLLEREIDRVLRSVANDANADFLAGKLTAPRWALAKARRTNRRRVQAAHRRPVNQP